MNKAVLAVLLIIGAGAGAAGMMFATGRLNLPVPEPLTSADPAPAASSSQKPADDDAAYVAFDQGHYLTALSLAEARAALGDPQAHTLIGRIYEGGLGVGKDDITAARWYARAAELGDVPAMLAFGNMLAEGRGVGKDRAAAAELYEKAAITGDPLANYNL
ncbi:MAG: tetratricopeptide repeat protein, partial [Deltaproteobacteria bacterium]